MSWIPAFRIGIWIAWMLMLIIPLQPLILLVIDRAVGTGGIYKKMGEAPAEKAEKRVNTVYTLIQYLLLAYSVFLPLKVGTPWLAAGLVIYFLGLGMLLAAIANAAATPCGQLFTGGLFRWSRHPLYLASGMILVGTGIACAAWVFLCLSAVLILLLVRQAKVEERELLARHGDEYREYMKRTPGWLGIPKS
jgi:protein-S-isoprenylcysteine O-methyltransferase Ste14